MRCPPGPTTLLVSLWVLGLGVGLAACGGETASVPSASASARRAAGGSERAKALLAPSALLPSRAEVVALADALAIESAAAGRPDDQAALADLAWRLRARLFRVGKHATDAREAMELAIQTRVAAGKSELGCSADLGRAELVGEMAHDAAALFGEVYVVSRRFDGLQASECLGRARRQLDALEPYRPSAEVLAELEASAASGFAPPKAAPSSLPAASAAPEPDPGADVLVRPPADLAKGPVKITRLDTFGSDKAARVVVHLSGPATFDVGELAADAAAAKGVRVYVDLAKASAKGVAKEKAVGGALERVRLAPRVVMGADGTRVVLDLAGQLGSAKLRRRVFYLSDPFRVVIDVGPRPTEPPPAALAAGSPRPVARVAIDAGHGGEDSGAVGPTGLREKDVTLDVAHRVGTLLAHELGVTTLLTRDSDTLVPLELRAARANAFHADLFVSIHCNANPDGQGRGVVSYVFDAPRQGDDLARVLLLKENGQKSGDSGDLGQLPSLTPAAVRASSRLLAELLQKAAMASLTQRYADTKDLGVRTAGFYVLAGADMPAVLFETSFISNSDEEQRLSKADYRQKLADGILNAMRAYREGKKP